MSRSGSEVAGQIKLVDPLQNMGAQLLREAAAKTMMDVGDGTTSTLLITESLLVQALRIITAGGSSRTLALEIIDAIDRVIEELESLSEPLTPDSARSIAMSAAQDREIGQFVAEALRDPQAREIVDVQAANHTTGLSQSVVKGMRLNAGYVDSRFRPKEGTAEANLEDAFVAVTTAVLQSGKAVLPIMEHARSAGKPLLILAHDIKDEALETCAVNFQHETVRVVCVRAPGVGETRSQILEDAAALVGTEIVVDEAGMKLSGLNPKQLGYAANVRINSHTTTILGGRGDSALIDAAITRVRSKLKDNTSGSDRKSLEDRLARLQCRSTILRIGGASDLEVRERCERAQRAVSALIASVGGVVAGGGVSLLRAGDSLRIFDRSPGLDLGARVVGLACEVIVRQLAVNSGYDDGVVVSRIRASSNLGFGLNVNSSRFEDLLNSGIIDPLNVLVTALRSAASLATTLITARVAIFETSTRIKSDVEKKYANKGGYSVSRSLAWPLYELPCEVRGFANLLKREDDLGEATQIWELESGIERTPIEGPAEAVPVSHSDLDFTISISSPSADIKPPAVRILTLHPRDAIVKEVFQLAFHNQGNHTVSVEFYFRRIWLGQIPIDITIERGIPSGTERGKPQ